MAYVAGVQSLQGRDGAAAPLCVGRYADVARPPHGKAYAALPYARDIVWAGRVEPDTLNGYVAASEAMVYVSEFEGFGIPVVEAFAAETAVITSDVTSMPEVGGDAVCYVNPYDVASIGAGMKRVAGDTAYRADLIARGRRQREKFSWDESARRFDEAITRWMAAQNR